MAGTRRGLLFRTQSDVRPDACKLGIRSPADQGPITTRSPPITTRTPPRSPLCVFGSSRRASPARILTAATTAQGRSCHRPKRDAVAAEDVRRRRVQKERPLVADREGGIAGEAWRRPASRHRAAARSRSSRRPAAPRERSRPRPRVAAPLAAALWPTCSGLIPKVTCDPGRSGRAAARRQLDLAARRP